MGVIWAKNVREEHVSRKVGVGAQSRSVRKPRGTISHS